MGNIVQPEGIQAAKVNSKILTIFKPNDAKQFSNCIKTSFIIEKQLLVIASKNRNKDYNLLISLVCFQSGKNKGILKFRITTLTKA